MNPTYIISEYHNYRKSPKFLDTHAWCNQPKIQTEIFSIEKFILNVQIEWQTVQTLIRLLH